MAATSVIKFPKAKKRGAKVRTGAMAEVLAFPAPLSGPALHARWAWLERNYFDWRCLDASDHEPDADRVAQTVNISKGVAFAYGKRFDDATMRDDMQRWTGVVEKRAAIREWLLSLGAESEDLQSAQAALSFVYEAAFLGNKP